MSFLSFVFLFFCAVNGVRVASRGLANLAAWVKEASAKGAAYKQQMQVAAVAAAGATVVAPAIAAPAVRQPAKPLVRAKASPSPAAPHVFQVADATHLVIFNEGWSVTVRIYQDLNKATRHLRCTDRALIGRVLNSHQTNVFDLGEAPLQPGTIDTVMRQAEVDGLAKLGEVIDGLKVAASSSSALQQPQAVPAAQVAGSDHIFTAIPEVGAAVDIGTAVEKAAVVVSDKPVTSEAVPFSGEYRVNGVVVSAGLVPAAIGDGRVFQVELKRVNSDKVETFRGMDLAAQCEKLGIMPGERIKLSARSNPAAQTNKFAPRKLFSVERV